MATSNQHFEDLLNRSDITSTLTTRFIDQGIAVSNASLRTPMSEKLKNYTITAAPRRDDAADGLPRNHQPLCQRV